MDPAVIALFRELADRSPLEREEYYARQSVPAAVRAEVESLLRFDGETLEGLKGRLAAVAARVLLDGREALDATRMLPDGREAVENTAPFVPGPALTNGTVFGPYRIVRHLGRGGMGVVYEADEIESGRPVALKVLHGPQQDASERARFEREGRLAASVNHPNCVFVFGAGEIDGHLVIAMEVMQGTLADRLKADGPLAPAAAVDATLQLVAGLQVAAAAGILHRDVKPSNCFVDAQGGVKIGDFGISRSQRPTEETALSTGGQRRATPAYASPEQLRGAALDVRADIYSVGATLHELLTGRRPFERPDLMSLLMAVANDAPTAPHVIAPAVPKGLSAVVLHCLAKQPEQRFSDYEALAAALEPYSSAAPTTGTLGRRCLAGLIDAIPIFLAALPISLWWNVNWLSIPPLLTVCLIEVLYFASCESRWAASPGKAICGLMIVQQGGTPVRGWQAIVRAIVYVMVPAAPVIALFFVSRELAESQLVIVGIGRVSIPPAPLGRVTVSPESLEVASSVVNGLMLLVLFSTARRRNGYAGLHDLISRSRVVERRVRAVEGISAAVPAVPGEVVGRLGPFAVLRGAIPGLPDGWRPGFDERLRRAVWIREVAPGTPPISLARRTINRATRLRWLAGRRNEDEAWDAFEAVQGVPLERAASRPRTWQAARSWVRDLLRECGAQGGDEDQPPRRRDRVWILDSGGAKLIDDPAHDYLAAAAGANTPVALFLLDVARTARGSTDPHAQTVATPSPPWPHRAHQFLEQLTAEPDADASSIQARLETLMGQRAVVTHGWRALALAVPLLLPVFWALAVAVLMAFAAAMTRADGPIPADVRIAARLLQALDQDARGPGALPAGDREAIEEALATRYRAGLTDDRLFVEGSLFLGMTADSRRRAAELLRRPPSNAAGPTTRANPTVEALVKVATSPEQVAPWYAPGAVGLVMVLIALIFVAAVALVDAVLFRGGVMRVVGLEMVTADGRLASRRRVLARTALAWAPVLLLAGIAIWGIARGGTKDPVSRSVAADAHDAPDPSLVFSSRRETGQGLGSRLRHSGARTVLLWLIPPCLLLMLVGAVVAILTPARGLHDRFAGTWIVPR